MSHKYFRKRQYSTAIKYPGTTPLEGGTSANPTRGARRPRPNRASRLTHPRPGRADADHTPTCARPLATLG